MKSRLMQMVGCLVTVALVALGVHRLGYIVRPTDTDSTYGRIKSFHALPKNSVDVIVYGSSHAFLGINTLEMYEKYGIGAYNYGTNWEKINTTKLFLQDSLLTQTPKLVLIDTYFAGSVLEDTNITGEIYFTRYLDESKARLRFLRKCFGNDLERYLSFYMPLCAFHDNWNSLTKLSFTDLDDIPLPTVEETHQTLGYAPYDTVERFAMPDPAAMEQLPLEESALAELDEIVEICRQRGIDILFFTVPYGMKYGYNDAMDAYARENGCRYLNLFEHLDEMGFDGSTDLKDEGHLNISGATKVADYVGKYISENYRLQDMRVDGNDFFKQLDIALAKKAALENVDYSASMGFKGATVFGRSTQAGIPSPKTPLDIRSTGDAGSVRIAIQGKNLLRNSAKSREQHGVAITKNSDGTIHVRGTALETFNCIIAKRDDLEPLLKQKGNKALLSGCPAGGTTTTYRLNAYGLHEPGTILTDTGSGAEFEICDFSASDDVFVAIRLDAGQTYDIVFSPMICLASEADTTFAPFGNVVAALPTPNGLCGIPVSSGGNHTDANGQRWICDTIDWAAGEYIQRVQRVELTADMPYTVQQFDGYSRICLAVGDTPAAPERQPVLCNRGCFDPVGEAEGVAYSASSAIWFHAPGAIDSEEAFKAWLQENPTEILYILSVPIVNSLSPDQLSAIEELGDDGNIVAVYDSLPAA